MYNQNPVVNIEKLIDKYFDTKVTIKDKSKTNSCIGALVYENDFEEFKSNFEKRLQRLSAKITDEKQRKEVVEKIKNIAEKVGYKWSGPYAELVVLDFFLDSHYIDKPCFINKLEASNYPKSIAFLCGRKWIDIDFSFHFRLSHFYTDVKSLIHTQTEFLESITESVSKKIETQILIGVDDIKPESLLDLQKIRETERFEIEKGLLREIENHHTRFTYTTQTGSEYNFVISYSGSLGTMKSKNPYELARYDKYKYLNYSDKLLDTDYSILTFVVNPWFNQEISDFCNYNSIYYRSVCRRVFMEFKNDQTIAKQYFKGIMDKNITFGDISKNIAGILFIEDNSIELKGKHLYEGYLYLNPNYKNKKPLCEYDFASMFSGSTIASLTTDDFYDDNY